MVCTFMYNSTKFNQIKNQPVFCCADLRQIESFKKRNNVVSITNAIAVFGYFIMIEVSALF